MRLLCPHGRSYCNDGARLVLFRLQNELMNDPSLFLLFVCIVFARSLRLRDDDIGQCTTSGSVHGIAWMRNMTSHQQIHEWSVVPVVVVVALSLSRRLEPTSTAMSSTSLLSTLDVVEANKIRCRCPRRCRARCRDFFGNVVCSSFCATAAYIMLFRQ